MGLPDDLQSIYKLGVWKYTHSRHGTRWDCTPRQGRLVPVEQQYCPLHFCGLPHEKGGCCRDQTTVWRCQEADESAVRNRTSWCYKATKWTTRTTEVHLSPGHQEPLLGASKGTRLGSGTQEPQTPALAHGHQSRVGSLAWDRIGSNPERNSVASLEPHFCWFGNRVHDP